MKNWQTTLMGIVFAVALNSTTLGIPEKVSKPLSGVAAIIWATMQKDRSVTGVGDKARREGEF